MISEFMRMEQQRELEKMVLRHFVGDGHHIQSHHENAGEWVVFTHDEFELFTWKGRITNHPGLELVDSGRGISGPYFHVRFTQPPRITYGDGDAEIARLRAAGEQVSKELDHWNDKLDLTCRFCEGSYMYHQADCPIPIFLEEHKA